jgi:hypothetical protein
LSGEAISSLPTAVTINGQADYTVVSQATGIPGAPYRSVKALASLVAGLNPTTTATAIEYIAGGSGGPLGKGLSGYLVAPYSGTIASVTLLANTMGSIQVNIWRCSANQFDAGATHPVASDSICGSNPPRIVNGVIYTDIGLAGWQKLFNTGDIFAYNIDSTSNVIGQITLSIGVTKTSIP